MSKIEIGSIIDDRYKVNTILGSGGMGTVYAATEILLARDVALKLIHKSMAVDQKSQIRFKREADALCNLEHNNIVRLLRFGTWQSMPYLVMEKLSGKSLQQILNENDRLSPRQAVGYALQITRGLMAMHSIGVIHRDLKPANVFVTTDDTVKLLDFGLCKVTAENSEEVQKLTESGILIGSVQYMSPEMCNGQPADGSADIYAVGIILFEMLTGALPFAADNPVGLLFKHVNEPVPSLKENYSSMPRLEEFDTVIQKCLAKQKTDRWSDTQELYSKLEKLYEILPESGPVVAARPPKRAVFRAGSAVIASICVLLMFMICANNPSFLAALLCIPCSTLMAYPNAVRQETKIARDLEKVGETALAEQVWQNAETLASKADDRLMLANIVANLASIESARADNGDANRHAYRALELLCKPTIIAPPKAAEDRMLYKETIAKSCSVLKAGNLSWSRRLDQIADPLNLWNGPIATFPEAILPLNLLKKEIIPQPDDIGMAWACLRIGGTYLLMEKYDAAIKCTKEAVGFYQKANDGYEFGMANLGRRYLKAYTAMPSNNTYFEEGQAALAKADRLYRELLKHEEDAGKRKNALGELKQLEIDEAMLHQVRARFKKTELRP